MTINAATASGSSRDLASVSTFTPASTLKEAWKSVVTATPEAAGRTAALAEKIVKAGCEGKLGDERWNFYEQAFIAALEVDNRGLAETCYQRLKTRFPDSLRVRRLQGMQLEADGKLDDAHKVYRDILEEDETNIMAAKRIITLHKVRGKTSDAIASLVKFLDIVYNDTEAWLELSDLYLKENLHQQAAFCMEELVLLEPNNHLYHLKLAEISQTMGSYSVALKTFCRVVELRADHLRGLYGIKQCTRRLLATSVPSAPPAATLKKLDALATERLSEAHASLSKPDGDAALAVVVRGWLDGKDEDGEKEEKI